MYGRLARGVAMANLPDDDSAAWLRRRRLQRRSQHDGPQPSMRLRTSAFDEFLATP